MPVTTRTHNAIAVFTGKSIDHILDVGGSESWVLDHNKASNFEYLVCCRSGVSWVEGPEPHGSAFMVAKIADVIASNETPGRWLITISEYARCAVPNAWKGWRNPVKYTTLDELDIDPSTLSFEPAPSPNPNPPRRVFSAPPVEGQGAVMPLTIAQAKAGLAATFGVALEDVQITIKG